MNKNLSKLMIAGKLAVGIQAAYASNLGKAGEQTSTSPELNLLQVGAPYDIITLPQTNSKSGDSEGVIYTQLAANQRLDFVIEGIRSDVPVQVYLAYSSGAGKGDLWTPMTEGQGQVELNPDDLNLVAALEILPATDLTGGTFDTPLGTLNRTHESITLPIQLSDLANLAGDGEKIHFQAVAFPYDENGPIWALAQASDVDTYIVNYSSPTNLENDSKSAGNDGGGKDTGTDNGGKDTGGTTDNGGK